MLGELNRLLQVRFDIVVTAPRYIRDCCRPSPSSSDQKGIERVFSMLGGRPWRRMDGQRQHSTSLINGETRSTPVVRARSYGCRSRNDGRHARTECVCHDGWTEAQKTTLQLDELVHFVLYTFHSFGAVSALRPSVWEDPAQPLCMAPGTRSRPLCLYAQCTPYIWCCD